MSPEAAPYRIRSLAVITHGYPCAVKPTWLVFVRQIAHAFARQGVQVSVICPLAIHRAVLGRDPVVSTEDAGNGTRVTVYRPRFISLSARQIGPWNTFRLTVAGIRRSTMRVIQQRLAVPPDAVYGHFMYPAGAVAVSLGRTLAIPSFPAAGEISLDTIAPVGRRQAYQDLAPATAFIANSSHLSLLLQHELGLEAKRIGVFPNGIDRRLFYPRDRDAMRRKYGLPLDRTLVAFVGGFETRKGARRVAEAIRGVPHMGGVFVGAGAEAPEGEEVLLCRRMPQENIPDILSACDMFALPTTDEGCCNAIVEAMACGLPVVSSNGAFNDDILNAQVSLRVDPWDVGALRTAILQLRDSPERRATMSQAALEWVVRFDIDQRARSILAFMRAEAMRSRSTPVDRSTHL